MAAIQPPKILSSSSSSSSSSSKPQVTQTSNGWSYNGTNYGNLSQALGAAGAVGYTSPKSTTTATSPKSTTVTARPTTSSTPGRYTETYSTPSNNIPTSSNNSSSSPSTSTNAWSAPSNVSLRDAASSLGANVGYDPNTGQVSVKGANGKSLNFGNGQGSDYGLSGLDNGSNMVSDFDKFAAALGYSPVRDAAESRGLSVGWNGSNNSINLSDPNLGISNTLSGNFALGSNGKSYMSNSDINNLFNSYDQMKAQAVMPEVPQVLTPMQQQIQQYMQALNTPVATAPTPDFNGLLQTAQAGYDSKIRAADGTIDDAKQSLEDQYFQKYLAARQAIADRGLAGSGLAGDQDTRLLLAKQRDLAGIERTGQNAKLDAADWLNGQNAQIADKKVQAAQAAAVNAQNAQNDKLKMLGTFISQMMPYEQAKVSDQLKSQLGYDTLDQKNKQFYDGLDQKYYATDMKKQIADDTNDWRYYNTDANTNLGYTKNDTINNHYVRSDANDAERNQIGWGSLGVAQANAETNRGDLNRKITADQNNLQQKVQQASNTEAKFKLSQLQGQLSQAGQTLRAVIQSGGNEKAIANAMAEYQKVANMINSVSTDYDYGNVNFPIRE